MLSYLIKKMTNLLDTHYKPAHFTGQGRMTVAGERVVPQSQRDVFCCSDTVALDEGKQYRTGNGRTLFLTALHSSELHPGEVIFKSGAEGQTEGILTGQQCTPPS